MPLSILVMVNVRIFINFQNHFSIFVVMYTDEHIKELINCPKKVIDAPREMKENRGSYKRGFELSSIDNVYRFTGFISKNKNFSENFSIGLVYWPKDEKGSICLLRCNGPHGGTLQIPHHAVCHIHKVKADDINNGIKCERDIQESTEYSTIEEAVQFFIRYVGILPKDRQKYFPPPTGAQNLFE